MESAPAMDRRQGIPRRRLMDMIPSRRDLAPGLNDYRVMFFLSACGVYAFFGSPTPSRFGVPEVLTGLFLVLAIGAGQASTALFRFSHKDFWRGAGQVFLLYGLSIPLIVSVVNGQQTGAVLRDMIPFLFLFLPLFLLPLFERKPRLYRDALCSVLLVGFVFALRSLLMRSSETCMIWCTDELLYLENMPSVLFCALFLIGSACARLMRRSGIADIMWFVSAVALALVPLAAMALTLQRASIGASALYLALLFAYLFYKRPYRAFVLGFCATLAMVMVGFIFSTMIESLAQKTALVGLNNRPQEFRAVWEIVSESPARLLFGIGWGGHFHSPAVGGVNVNFTHNFFTTVLLKTGLCGLFLALGYILGLLEKLANLVLRNPVLGLALCAPVLIDLTLYASFKSLDFGLALLLIPASLIYSAQSESDRSL